jgi:lipid II:glycine glycyltransferase (peptidoglycan interpeptide bridge formation enzyme)
MEVYSFDPLHDARWTELVGRHPKASVFHTTGWLKALRHTYGFEPIAFTTSRPADQLANALVFTKVRSWLTGCRLVSLPFSDHCEPLVDTADELRVLCLAVLRYRAHGSWRYVEVRSATWGAPPEDSFAAAQTFWLHRLDLDRELGVLLHSFHKDSIQRKIRRAEREGLTYEHGRSEALLHKLCHLLDLTRQRHQVPLQPLAWFRHLIACLGDSLCIRIASKDGEPAAGILTLAFRDRVVYKYGGSDVRLNPLGGMPFLLWKTIQDARQIGARELDLGRSDDDNTGLIVFKDRWGARRSTLTYWRAPGRPHSAAGDGWKMRLAKRVFSRLPRGLRRASGSLLYPHIG